MKTSYALAVLAVLTLVACNDDPDTQPPGNTTDQNNTQPEPDMMDPDPDPDMGDPDPDMDDPDMDDPPVTVDPTGGSWVEGFSVPGLVGSFGTRAHAMVETDDGDVIVGGRFLGVPGLSTQSVARWDGTQWHPITDGLDTIIKAMAKDPNTGKIYLAGQQEGGFGIGLNLNAIFSWDGSTWAEEALVGGEFTSIEAMHVTASGDLIVGGRFTGVGQGPQQIPNLAIRDAASGEWRSLGASPDGQVNAIDEIPGRGVCFGGFFQNIGDVPAANIGCIDAGTPVALGDGVPGEVFDLISDGGAGELVAAGSFAYTLNPDTGTYAAGLARFDGTSWGVFAGGVQDGSINKVRRLERLQDGSLLAAGVFRVVDKHGPANLVVGHIAVWDGTTWSTYGEGVLSGIGFNAPGEEGIYDVIVHDDSTLTLGGMFSDADGQAMNGIARYDGTAYQSLAPEGFAPKGIAGFLNELEVMDDGRVIVAGGFGTAGTLTTQNIAIFDPETSTYEAIGEGLNGSVWDVAIHPVTGDIWACGDFFESGPLKVSFLARFNGQVWESVSNAAFNATVQTMIFDGDTLYVGGAFSTLNRQPVNHVARFDGVSWSGLGDGLGSDEFQPVTALAVDDEGRLIAGGLFTGLPDGSDAQYLAIWDGTEWAEYAGGLTGRVSTLIYEDGVLTVAGTFAGTRDGTLLNSIGQFDGESWKAFGEGLVSFDMPSTVGDVVLYGGGVFATGTFGSLRGMGQPHHIGWWDGERWVDLGEGINDLGEELAVDERGLWVGGVFTVSGEHPAYGLARWEF